MEALDEHWILDDSTTPTGKTSVFVFSFFFFFLSKS